MAPRILLITLGLVAVLGLGWWAMDAGGPGDSGPTIPGGAASPAPSTEGVPEDELDRAPDLGRVAATGARAPLEAAEAETEAAKAEAAAPELPEHHVRVRVLTHAGAPAAGVDVSLCSKLPLRDSQTITSATTDDSGEAVLHSTNYTKLVTDEGSLFGRPTLRVLADIPMTKEVAAVVPWPTDPGVDSKTIHGLRLPPLGSVTVHVVDPEGEPYLEPVGVGGRWVPTIEVGAQSYGGYNRCQDYGRRTIDGSTCYPFVGTGVSMSFTVQAAAFANGYVRDVPITAGSGSNQDVTIQLGARRPLVRCRVLAPDGEPLASEELEARVWHAPESGLKRPFSNPTSVQTDAEGRLEFYFKFEPDQEHPRRLYLERLARGSKGQSTGNVGRGDMALPTRLSSALEHDLGTVRFAAPEIFQQGTVYDFKGEPASGARLSFYSEVPGEPPSGKREDPIGMVYSARDGTFDFRGFERPPGLRVEIQDTMKIDGSSRRVYGRQRGLAVGDRSASLFLEAPTASTSTPRGSVPVSVLFDDDLPGEYFAVGLSQGKGRGEAIPMSFLKDTPMPMKLEPGTWTLRVFLYELKHDLLVIEGIQVEENQTLVDSRCLPIDMRGLARRARFAVKRTGGAPLRGTRLYVRAAVPPIDGRLRTGEDGYIDAAFPRACSAIELSEGGEAWTSVDLSTVETAILTED